MIIKDQLYVVKYKLKSFLESMNDMFQINYPN